jgi:hypothetical protein
MQKPWDISDDKEIWENGLQLTDNKGHIAVTLPESENGLRVFLSGGLMNLAAETWVESNRLERNGNFLLMCQKHQVEKISEWGNKECEVFFEKKNISIGFSELQFFEGKNPKNSLPDFNKLSLPNVTNIRLEGGLRKKGERGRVYLQTAPPIICIEGGFGDEIALLKIDGSEFSLSPFSQGLLKWEIPYDTPAGVLLKIEVGKREADGTWLRSDQIAFTLLPSDISVKKDLIPKRGPYGEQLDGENSNPKLKQFVIGANVLP